MHVKKLQFFVVLVSLWVCSAIGATYYVDFNNGDDASSGLSPNRPFKHSPGDRMASRNAKAVLLLPGDIVRFKGGVRYRGSIDVVRGGEEGKAIVFDGNADGAYGEGKAIIEGAEPIEDWRPCKSHIAKNVYCSEYPKGAKGYHLNIFQGSRPAILAQDPQPKNYFRTDDVSEFYEIEPGSMNKGWLYSGRLLKKFDFNDLNSVIKVWAPPNLVYYRKVLAYDNKLGVLYFEPIPDYYRDRNTKFSIINNMAALDSEGEYRVDYKSGIVYYKPYDGLLNAGDQNEIVYSARPYGFGVFSSWVEIRGFVIERHIGPEGEFRSGIGIMAIGKNSGHQLNGLYIHDNEVRWNASYEGKGAITADNVNSIRIENNNVHHSSPGRGILVTNSENVLISGNSVSHVGRTGIALFSVRSGRVERNELENIVGVHANGISVYEGSENVIVNDNTVVRCNIAITTKKSSDITIGFNRLYSEGDNFTYADWGGSVNLTIINNTLLNEKKKALMITDTSYSGLRVINNIISGAVLRTRPPLMTHNVYVALAWNQSRVYKWALAEGESSVPVEMVFGGNLEKDRFGYSKKSLGILRGGAGVDASCCRRSGVNYIGPVGPL